MDCLVDFTDETVGYVRFIMEIFLEPRIINSQGYIAGNGKNGINEGGAWVTPFVLKSNDPTPCLLGIKISGEATMLKQLQHLPLPGPKFQTALPVQTAIILTFWKATLPSPICFMLQGVMLNFSEHPMPMRQALPGRI